MNERKDRRDEYRELYELKDLIKENVRQALRHVPVDKVRSALPSAGNEINRVIDRLVEKGILEGGSGGSAVSDGEREYRHFYRYRKTVMKKAKRAMGGIRAHAIPFFGVNAFLIFLWAMTGFGHPWFLYPLGAWGIGLMCHLTAARESLRRRREIEGLPDLTERETKSLKSMQRTRTGFSEHFTAVASLSGFLVMIDVITGGMFPWSLIPAAALGTGLFIHWSAQAHRMRRLRREVKELSGGPAAGRRRSAVTEGADGVTVEEVIREHEAVRETVRLRQLIVRQLDRLEAEGSGLGDEIRPLLDTYSGQIRELCRKESEVAEVVGLVKTEELDRERDDLQSKLDAEGAEAMKREYRRAIGEIDRQKDSLSKLEQQREILSLRIRSAVNSLRQLQIDLARMGSVSASDGMSDAALRDKFDELSAYLDDLNESYSELD